MELIKEHLDEIIEVIKGKNISLGHPFHYVVQIKNNYYSINSENFQDIHNVTLTSTMSNISSICKIYSDDEFSINIPCEDVYHIDNVKIDCEFGQSFLSDLEDGFDNYKFNFNHSTSAHFGKMLDSYFSNFKGFKNTRRYSKTVKCQAELGFLGKIDFEISYQNAAVGNYVKMKFENNIHSSTMFGVPGHEFELHYGNSTIEMVKDNNVDIMLMTNKNNKLFYKRFKKYI